MTLVVDASALLKMSRRGDLGPRLLTAHPHHAPRLLAWEVGNVVHGDMSKLFPTLRDRQDFVRDLIEPVEMSDQIGRLPDIGSLSEKYGLTFYDASYLDLAIDLDCVLLTEDGPMHDAAVKAIGAKRAWRLADAEREAIGSG